MAATTLIQSSSSFGSSFFAGGGLSTHRITKNPIISMTRSANVKIHSGHSSHSSSLFLHPLHGALAILVGATPASPSFVVWKIRATQASPLRGLRQCLLLFRTEEAH